MKKTALFLVVMLVMTMCVLSSCSLLEKIPGIDKLPLIGDLINKPCESHVDADSDYICDNCGAELEKNDTPTPCEHKDENKDHKCDLCEADMGEHKAAEGSHNCGYCNAAMSECAAAEGSHNCAICGKQLSDHVATEGGHNCAICGDKLSECAAAEGSHNCAICGNKLSECAAAENSHNCAICGNKLSECADADENYVCDICGAELERPAGPSTTIVLDPESEHATPVQGPQVVRVGEFEVILSSEKSRIEGKNVTFNLPDGSTSSQNYRINFNGSETIFADGKWQNAIMFIAGGKGSVTIYWQHGGKGSQGDTSSKAWRNVGIWNDKGELLDQTNGQFDYEDLRVTTFEFDAAGTYYIGNLAGANNFFYAEVKYEGEKVSLPEIEKFDVHFSTGGGSAIESVKVEKGALLDKPADPTKDGFEFDGWYKDEALTTAWNFSTDRISGEVTLYAKWSSAYTGEYEDVHYEVNISDLETGTRSEDEINGRFTIVSGTEVRNRTKSYEGVEYIKSVKIGSSSAMIKISVPGAGKLSFLIQNGSSGAATQFTQIIGPDGTRYDIEFAGNDDGSPVVKIEIDVTEGEWIIGRGKNGGTQDVFFISLDCSVPVSAETGFELVAPGKVDYLIGDTLNTSGIKLNATFASGKTEPLALENVTIDTSKVNLAVSGTYPITISYKDYAPISFDVNVFAPESIKLDFDAIEKIANSAAGNGVYFNHSFRELYFVGEELDTTGLSVTVIGKCGEATKEFKVSAYEIEGFSSSETNAITITVSYGGVSTTTTVHVTGIEITPDSNGVIQALVDPAYLGLVGELSGPYHIFTTIQQALDFLAKADANTPKVITIAPGVYKEKLEITVPNLTIEGIGEEPGDVLIEWDSLYGLPDAGGFTHTTDSTATVAIRDTATNVKINNVTISNAFNSKDYFDKTLGENYAEHRALALLVQADRFVMTNSILLGYQDTLELFTGRQYFKGVEIHGYTDFIFGTNNTTLFEDCVINTIYSGKSNGGYLTAFKGSNKGATDAITYGAIFYHCKFTADEGVADGLTAIGRPWGAYAAVAVIESELGAHIATTASGTASQNERYVIMSGVKPTDETVQFVEYNNTGAGAISEAVAGMRFLTAEEAAKYIDFAVIFGTTNNKVSYLDPWDPNATEVAEDDRTYYYFDQGSSTTGTSNTFDTAATIAKGGTLDWAGLHISAEIGNVAWNSNANALNMKAGAFISFDVPAGSTVSVTSYPGYNAFTINGVGTSADTLVRYFAEATTVTVASVGDLYLYNIIINPGEEAPEAATLTEIKVSGFNTNYVVGDELSFEGVSVKGYYSDNSVIEVSYDVDASKVVNTAEGEYEVIFSFEGKTAIAKVTFEDPNAGPEISKDTILDFTTPDGLAAVQNNPKVTIEGSVRHNGGEIQIKGTISFKVKAGTVVTVIPYHDPKYASFTIGEEGEENLNVSNEMTSVMFVNDCTVVYTGLDNNYLAQIIIECPIGEGKYVFGGSSAEGDVTGILESIPGLSISGKLNTHSGGAQLGENTQLMFIAPALSTITIQGYDTNYGQLVVYADGELVEMDANAQYVIKPFCPQMIIIEAKNVGTEEAPAWNKSYITYIQVDMPEFIEETTEITFGSAGNYKDSVVDFSGITIADNGGNNSQIKNGSFSFGVKAGAILTVHAYPGYASYNLAYNDIVYEGLVDEFLSYEIDVDGVIEISHSSGNNYFYSISIVYPVVFDENTTIDLSATNGLHIEGSTGEYEGLSIDATAGKFKDNGGGWVQVNQGTIIKLNVADGASVTAKTYQDAEIFEIAIADGVCTLTCTANGYIGAITVSYPVKESFSVTFGSEGNYKDSGIDFSGIQIGDNGGNNSQVKNGSFSFQVFAGATVTVNGYPGYTSYSFNGSEEITDSTYVFTATEDCTVTIAPVNGNNYFYSIDVAY